MSDIQIDVAFTAGQKNVGATELNNAVNNATIQPGFISDKTQVEIDANDELVFYDSSATALKSLLWQTLMNHDDLLNDRTAATPAEGDSLLLSDADDSDSFKKATLSDILLNAMPQTLISALTDDATPAATDVFMKSDASGVALKKITLANLFYQWWTRLNLDDASITALSGTSAVQETDTLIVADADASDATKKLTIGGLIKFLTAGSNAIDDADQMLLYDSVAAGGRSITLDKVKTYAQSGCIIQVLQAVSTAKQTIADPGDNSWSDVTSLTQAITCRDANSKVLVRAVINASTANNNHYGHFRIVRDLPSDPTAIGVGDAASSRIQCGASVTCRSVNADNVRNITIEFLDSPATASEVTYYIQARVEGGDVTVNASDADTDGVDGPRTISALTVQEVAV